MDLLVVEYVSGGGLAGQSLPPSLLAEGRAMLAAILADLWALGTHRLTTLCDGRLDGARLAAHRVIPVEPGGFDDALEAALAQVEAALIIAPETGGVLADLSERVQAAGVRLLGSDPEAVRLAGDKACTAERLARAGLPVPPWRLLPLDAPPLAAGLELPLVVKPVDGAGCEGVGLVRRPADVGPVMSRLRAATSRYDYLVQQYVPGVHASAALLVAGGQVEPLALNSQDVAVGRRFHYRGGTTPLAHPLAGRALAVARAACQALPGLRGYVGVDLVLTEHEAYVIEINPRLTTAYVGLRRAVAGNLAAAILAAALDGRLEPPGAPLWQVRFTASGRVAVGGMPVPCGSWAWM